MPIGRIRSMVSDFTRERTSPSRGTSPLGQICGYELSLHKHDDVLDDTVGHIPFTIELISGEATMALKPDFNQLDCEIKQTYSLFLRAYDCAAGQQRRYSER